MNKLRMKIASLFTDRDHAREDQKAQQAGVALRILEDAIEYLQPYGTGKNLEFQRARIILQGCVDSIWADFGYRREFNPAGISAAQ